MFDIKSQGSLGGVVNIITRKAEKGFHAAGSLSAGSYDFFYKANSLNSDVFRIGSVWGSISVSPVAGYLAQVSYSHRESDHVLYPYPQMDAREHNFAV